MAAVDFYTINHCATGVHPVTMNAVVTVESSHNPYAIGVVGGRLVRQPTNKEEAVATAEALAAAGWNFSVGVGQVNRYNLPKYGLSYADAFEPCANLKAAGKILKACYDRAKQKIDDEQLALRAALSCYYSGNFKRGQVPDGPGQVSYVDKVAIAAGSKPIPVVTGVPIPVQPVKAVAGSTKGVLQVKPARAVVADSAATAEPNVPVHLDGFSSGSRMLASAFAGNGAGEGNRPVTESK